jgi:Flp pilus assembly protein TadB
LATNSWYLVVQNEHEAWGRAMNASNVRFILYFCLTNIFFVIVANELTNGQALWIRASAAVAAATGTTIVFAILRNRMDRMQPKE